MTILDKYKTSGNLVLHIPFKKGTLLDDSGNGNNATVTGLVSWKNTSKARGISACNESSYITITDNGAAPELQITSGFMYWFGSPLSTVGATMRFFSKRDVGGNDFDFYIAPTSVQFYAGAVNSTATVTTLGKRFFGVRITSGQKPAFFIDGVFVGDGNNAVTPTANDADLLVSNYYVSGAGRNNPNPCHDVGIINTATITDQEIAQLYNELMAEGGYGDPKVSNFHYPISPDSGSGVGNGTEIVTNGGFETGTPPTGWSTSNVTFTRESGTRTGGSGSYVGQLAYDGVNAVGQISETILTVAKSYVVKGWYKTDGVATGSVFVGSGTSFTLDASATWKYFEGVYTCAGDGVLRLRGNSLAAGRYIQYDDVSVQEVKCTLHWDMATLAGDSKMLDRSGNGRSGTMYALNKTFKAPFDCSKYNGKDTSYLYLSLGYGAAISGNNMHGWGGWLLVDSFATSPMVLSSNAGDYYLLVGSGSIILRCGGSSRTYSVSVPIGKWTHLYFEKTGANDAGNLYIDNVLQSSYTGTIASTGVNAGADLWMGAYVSAGYSLNGNLCDWRFYSSNLTAAERTKLYLDGAKRIKTYIPMGQDAAVTLANVTAGPIGNSLWNVYSGTWSVVEANGRKWLNCLGGYSAYTQQKSAYGTFYWKTCLGSALTNNVYLSFIATGKGVGGLGNTYYLQVSTSGRLLLVKTGPSSIVNTDAGFLAENIYYEFIVTRSLKGEFNVYVKGGAYTTWTLALTATDTTYTTSQYAVASAEAAQSYRVSDFRILNGVVSPITYPELFL